MGRLKNRGEVFRLEKLLKRYERGLISHVDWLDNLTLAKIQQIREASNSAN